ncbi:DUF4988 domain-containing protein [Synechococcus sp. PCC 6312]|uniref:DUF4988 domain-containing protein n=1 Tax=Synechococcus sp. (strain ATCC 27167 / PCC 6312) TaxID=195253 RepID=UPI00209CBF56|nr:DUF4988 domain-containing protein [Synechococcus sp. PCC 6312]
MMTEQDFQQAVLSQLQRIEDDVDNLKQDVSGLKKDVDGLKQDVDALKQELTLTNVRVDTYQKASGQVVNLAFGLIVTATATIIASTILR